MKRWIYFITAIVLYMIVHEYCHGVMSLIFNEYEKIVFHWYGPEVLYKTPVEGRTPHIKWFFISGLSNLMTLSLGYLIFFRRNKINNIKDSHIKNILYYAGIVFLLFDAINLSVGPFIYEGDAAGIAAGIKTNTWIIQIFFGIILLVNRELIITFMRSFGIKSSHILFKSFRHQ